MWRVDWLETGHWHSQTTWCDDEDAALAEASRLRFTGCANVVAWLDLGVTR